MNISIIAPGKIKERYFSDAAEEYKKRISRYGKVDIIELKDEPTPDSPTEREREIILSKEGERIKEKIPKGAFVVALCVEGKQKSSEELAKIFEDAALCGKSRIAFVIGGSLGLSQDIKDMADLRLSFSKMTFPHKLMRIVLLEQIYRAFTICEGKTYHK